MSYRNAVYNSKKQAVDLFTWNEDGERIRVEVSHNPYLYVEDPRGEKTSIFGTKLRKKEFPTQYERNKFVNESGVRRVFENIGTVQQCLLDIFWQNNEDPNFTKNQLKITYVDIETYSVDSFPNIDDPDHTVNVITCYDTFSKTFHTFGLKQSKHKRDNVIYHHCKDEKALFIKFIEYLEADYPDILSGWNSTGFDFPYIINRIGKILGNEYVKRLSPTGNVYHRLMRGKFGKEQKRYYIEGISCIDYLDIYQRFCLKLRESYKLDSIGEIELNERKVDYGDIDLATLADTDWEKFIDYNIQDVNLIIRLEEKLQYISLLRMLSYVGLTTLEGAMGTISVINGALVIKSRKRGEIISTFIRSQGEGKNPGAYVSEPKRGFKESVVSFDANSLYPNVMISLNLSPETKVGKIEKTSENEVVVQHVSGKVFNLTKEKFAQFIKAEDLAVTRAGFLFSQKKIGIIPEFLDHYYHERVKIKESLFECKKRLATLESTDSEYQELKYEVERLNTKQMVIKILVNSCYGYMGNKQAPIGDDDIASSVTLTGQAVIKQAGKLLKDYLRIYHNIQDESVLEDSWVYSDTDSYIGETQLVTDRGTFDAEALWYEYASTNTKVTSFGHDIQQVDNLNILSYDKHDDKVKFRSIRNLIRHKVSKGQYKITVENKSITMTQDHGCIVIRDGKLVRVSAKDIIKGDKMLIRR